MDGTLRGGERAASGQSDSARTRVYQEIRQRIITAWLAPGARISENELADRFSVSRQPVREALMLLVRDGLVTVRPKSGSYVSLIDEGEVRNAQFVRESIELHSLEHARRPDRAEQDAIRRIVDAQRAATTAEGFSPLDEQFHRALLGLGGHADAWATLETAKAHLDRARYLGFEATRTFGDFTDDHARIAAAVADGRFEEAHGMLQTHLRCILDDLAALRVGRPEYFPQHAAG